MECFRSEETVLQILGEWQRTKGTFLQGSLESPQYWNPCCPLPQLGHSRSYPVPATLHFFFFPCCDLRSLFLVNLLLAPQSPAHGTWHQSSTPLLLPLPIPHPIRARTYPRLGKELLWSNSIWVHLLSFTFFVYDYGGAEVALRCRHPSGAFHLGFLRPGLSLAQSQEG